MKKYGIKHEVASSNKIHKGSSCATCGTYEWKVLKGRERQQSKLQTETEKEEYLQECLEDFIQSLL